MNYLTHHCDTQGTRAKLLAALRENPYASIDDLSRAAGKNGNSNVWYHLRIMEKRGVRVCKGHTIHSICARLVRISDLKRAEGAKLRGKSNRATGKRLTTDALIEQVVAKANGPVVDVSRARLVVGWNGRRWEAEAR